MKRSFIIILHIGYWLLYLLLLTVFLLFLEAGGIKTISQQQERMIGFLRVMGIMTLLPGLFSFYSFYHFLFDKYLAARKITALCIAAVITAIISGLIGMLGLSLLTWGKMVMNNRFKEMSILLIVMSLLALIHGVIGLVMRGFITWYGDIRIKEALRQKNFETELALVKLQLSPHFLFNTINNIDVLIEKDPVKASAYLNKLSDIMRFMLYETKPENIPLEKELAYISKYVDLQKIRTSNVNFVDYSVSGESNGWMIAPMLFIPFIENAFKHSGNKKEGTGITIKISIAPENIQFYCSNNFPEHINIHEEAGGLGNELIQKRLALLYPGKHELEIKQEKDTYIVKVGIER